MAFARGTRVRYQGEIYIVITTDRGRVLIQNEYCQEFMKVREQELVPAR